MSTRNIHPAFIAMILAGTISSATAQSRPSKTSAAASPPAADSGTSVPNALQGFQQNRGQPVQIEAARLEVRDKDKVATFTGNVKVVQGDTTMHCKVLVVFYEKKDEAQGSPGAQAQASSKPGAPMPAAAPGPGGSSQINRLEAKGNVVVTQKDQTATGDTGLFDMKSNTVTMTGNVLVSQGQNVLRGEKLVVDLTTGVSRVDSGGGLVRMLLNNGGPQPAAQPGAPASNAQQGAAQPSTGSPKFSPQRIY